VGCRSPQAGGMIRAQAPDRRERHTSSPARESPPVWQRHIPKRSTKMPWPTVSQTAPEHMMNCEPIRVLGKISVYSPGPHHSRNGSAAGRCSNSLADGTEGGPSGRPQLRQPNVARASHRTLAALGVVHGGEPSRPPRAHGCELVPPIWSASTAATRHLGMPVRSDPGRSSPASAA